MKRTGTNESNDVEIGCCVVVMVLHPSFPVAKVRGTTRSHPEHGRKNLIDRWYCAGSCMGE